MMDLDGDELIKAAVRVGITNPTLVQSATQSTRPP